MSNLSDPNASSDVAKGGEQKGEVSQIIRVRVNKKERESFYVANKDGGESKEGKRKGDVSQLIMVKVRSRLNYYLYANPDNNNYL
jgi:hypothetical protein